MCALLALLVLGAQGQTSPRAVVPRAQTSSYIVIIDAGSTGTRAHAFHYSPRVIESLDQTKRRSLDLVVAQPTTLPAPLFSVSVRPGVSSFVGRPDHDLHVYLSQLVDEAARKLRKEAGGDVDLGEVPVYFGATAGMRGLDQEHREKLVGTVRRTLRSGPFHFAYNEQARVLSGEEEGAFGWLSVNYARHSVGRTPSTTFGALDMGGESAQISFIPETTSILANFFPMHVGVGTGPIHLYTHSFMSFGYVTAFQRVSHNVLNKSGDKHEMHHPCMPEGVSWRVEDNKFGVSTTEYPTRTEGPIHMEGKGSFEGCSHVAKSLLMQAPCMQPPCSLLGVYQPDLIRAKFSLNGEYAKAWKLLGPKDGEAPVKVPPLIALRERATTFCALSIKDAKKWIAERNGGMEPELGCWLGVWAYTLLVEGLQFPENTSNVIFETHKADWPQGQAIYEVNFFPYRVNLPVHHEKPVALRHNRLWIDLAGADGSDEGASETLAALALAVAAVALLASGVAIGIRLGRGLGPREDAAPFQAWSDRCWARPSVPCGREPLLA